MRRSKGQPRKGVPAARRKAWSNPGTTFCNGRPPLRFHETGRPQRQNLGSRKIGAEISGTGSAALFSSSSSSGASGSRSWQPIRSRQLSSSESHKRSFLEHLEADPDSYALAEELDAFDREDVWRRLSGTSEAMRRGDIVYIEDLYHVLNADGGWEPLDPGRLTVGLYRHVTAAG